MTEWRSKANNPKESQIRDQHKTRSLVYEIVRRMSLMIEIKIAVDKKDITSYVRKELGVLNKRLDGIDSWVKDRLPIIH